MDLLLSAQKSLRRYLVVRGVQSSTAQIHGHAIHFYQLRGTGSGPPVLLLHGLGGSANGFYRLFDGLARRFSRVVTLDLPGHGFSPLPDAGPLKLREQLEVVVEFWRRHVCVPCLVVGNSLGGAMSIMFASEHPEATCALALVAPAGAQWPQAKFEELARTMKVRTNADARALTRRLFHRAPVTALLFASELKKMFGSAVVDAAFAETDEQFIAPEVLAALTVPTLLLWGGSEKLLPNESVDYFRAHLPKHAQIEVVPGFGHVPQIERPKEVVRRLTQFADEARL